MSLADRRSALAASTGPKTLDLRRWLFALRVLERALFAIVVASWGRRVVVGLVFFWWLRFVRLEVFFFFKKRKKERNVMT